MAMLTWMFDKVDMFLAWIPSQRGEQGKPAPISKVASPKEATSEKQLPSAPTNGQESISETNATTPGTEYKDLPATPAA